MFFFFFNDTATTEIYTLSLHDALPILVPCEPSAAGHPGEAALDDPPSGQQHKAAFRRRQLNHLQSDAVGLDRKSTRLNSSHANISYAVFCLKKKKTTIDQKSCSKCKEK